MMNKCINCANLIQDSRRTSRCAKCRDQAKTASKVRYELKKDLGFSPPDDLVAEATALRLLTRAIRNK